MDKNSPVVLIIADGVGESTDPKYNSVTNANTPFIDKIRRKYNHTLLNTQGKFVGLPDGQMGNSEVGHLNIGAGRVVNQLITVINNDLKTGELFEKQNFKNILDYQKKHNSNIHILGLVSDGGVHSSGSHISSVYKYLREITSKLYLHAFTDGRDTPPTSAYGVFSNFIKQGIEISTICGRYYAMDRNNKWDRTMLSYDSLTKVIENKFTDPLKYLNKSYDNGIFDEFMMPAQNVNNFESIKENDVILFLNFRSDRARQLTHCLIGSDILKTNYNFEPPLKFKNIGFLSIAKYPGINCNYLYKFDDIKNSLGETLEKQGYSQIRAAETEKYPHVTFFFDGAKLVDFRNSEKLLVESPMVNTYDLQPEMSSYELTDKLINLWKGQEVVIINYAQPDMVGHTGDYNAAIKAVESLDRGLEKLYNFFVKEKKGVIILTADHGNVEKMIDKNNNPHTQHTLNKTLFLITKSNVKFKKDSKAKLADISPTLLKLLGANIPKEMTGNVLIED